LFYFVQRGITYLPLGFEVFNIVVSLVVSLCTQYVGRTRQILRKYLKLCALFLSTWVLGGGLEMSYYYKWPINLTDYKHGHRTNSQLSRQRE
jgi:hypothetical protein